MSSVADVFHSGAFHYVYTFQLDSGGELSSPGEVYELSERILSETDLEHKKRLIVDCFSLPVIDVKMDQIK